MYVSCQLIRPQKYSSVPTTNAFHPRLRWLWSHLLEKSLRSQSTLKNENFKNNFLLVHGVTVRLK